MAEPHKTLPVKVVVDIDEGIAPMVIHMNTIPGIRTLASCQGTIGEGGAEPYGPQVMFTWDNLDALAGIKQFYDFKRLGPALGYAYPNLTAEETGTVIADLGLKY